VAPDLVLAHLYPDLLHTYADRGNLLTLMRRAEWRGFSVEVAGVTLGERLPPHPGVIMIGGGTDRIQEVVAMDLRARRAELEAAVAEGAVLLGVCGGYQFLGAHYTLAEGRIIQGLAFLDVHTVAEAGRIVGRVVAQATLWGCEFELVGFENHAGRTYLHEGARPLATVHRGGGNNGHDKTEGAVRERVVGTYLHGPVLPANPAFADALLQQALLRWTGGAPLAALDDRLELAAHRGARGSRR
jgi:CobQ-like glutamine amidotransferase family enzyme